MEKLMVAKAISLGDSCETVFCGTRYGNVMASRGSVIPLFVKQIKEGKVLTITDPNMTRFLMSLNDAVDLVVYAFQHGRQGDRFVQKAPASTIKDLAKALIEIFNGHNEIRVIGTRHGEKLHETLLTREEYAEAEDLDGYYRIVPDNRDLNYNKYFTEGQEQVSKAEDYNSYNTRRLDIEEIKEILLQLDYIQSELAQMGTKGRGRIKTIEGPSTR